MVNGTVVSIEADDLSDGSAVKITGGSNTMGTGSLLNIESNTNSASNGIVRIDADNIGDGSAMTVAGGKDVSTGSLLNVLSKSTDAVVGVFQIVAESLSSGRAMLIKTDKLVDGDALRLENNGNNLTTGSLLSLESNATSPENGIVQLNANNIGNGK